MMSAELEQRIQAEISSKVASHAEIQRKQITREKARVHKPRPLYKPTFLEHLCGGFDSRVRQQVRLEGLAR